MSIESVEEQTDLTEENQYSGKIFWLNIPPGYELSLENLREKLDGRSFRHDISGSVDEESTEIPDVFVEDGEIVSQTSVDNADLHSTEFGEVILAKVRKDSSHTVTYRNKEILMLNNEEAHLIIFKHDGFSYLVVLAKREVAEGVAAILRTEYDKLGSAINPTRILPGPQQKIREKLNAELVDTIITDYPDKELTTVGIQGSGFEDQELYKEQRRRGKIKNHVFQTRKLVDDDEMTILIARDGLVRIYSNSTITTYLRLLQNHILSEVHRDRETSPSLSAYETPTSQNPIYVKTEDS